MSRTAKDSPRLSLILSALRNELPNLEKTYKVRKLGVFGPFARGTDRPRSTLNLVVEYHHSPTLIELAQLEGHLQDLLSLKVDLGIKGDLRPHVKQRVLRELVDV